MNADDTALVVAHTSSGAEQLAKKVRGAKVVSAFGTVPSEVLFRRLCRSVAKRSDRAGCIAVTMSLRRMSQRTLISDVGFEPVDAGPLRIARYLEPFTLLMAQLAYEGDRRAGARVSL